MPDNLITCSVSGELKLLRGVSSITFESNMILKKDASLCLRVTECIFKWYLLLFFLNNIYLSLTFLKPTFSYNPKYIPYTVYIFLDKY